jgi:hypothetical protein
MSGRPWFRTRARGRGWTPITWEGWLITVGLAALLVGVNLALVAHLVALRH